MRSGSGLATETTTYSLYDSLGRLAELTLPDGTCRRYSFDLDSNRTEVKEGPACGNVSPVATFTYAPGQGIDRLTSVTRQGQTTNFAYTTDGQVTQRGADTVDWDGRARHSGGTFAGTSLAYSFDATHFRRQRQSGGQKTRYLSGGLFETNDQGAITLAEVEGPAGDLAHYTGEPNTSSPVTYLYYSGHGDLAAEVSQAGARTASYTYDPFGALRSGGVPNQAGERYAGRWDKKLDSKTGLIEMGVRPYDPSIGRFYSVDPVDGGSANLYDYAFQDPIGYSDLDGKMGVPMLCFTGYGCGSWDDGPVTAVLNGIQWAANYVRDNFNPRLIPIALAAAVAGPLVGPAVELLQATRIATLYARSRAFRECVDDVFDVVAKDAAFRDSVA